MSMWYRAFILSGVLCINGLLFSQSDTSLIQFSGVIMTSDSLIGIPYSTVRVLHSNRGAVANFEGFFTIAVRPKDTLIFSAIGFKKDIYYVPSNLTARKYSILKLMTADTINLPSVVIYPFATKAAFADQFVHDPIPDDDLERARQNLDVQTLAELSMQLPRSASEAVSYNLKTHAQQWTHYGQVPEQKIFSPIAWAQFLKAWKEGKFKRKDD